MMWAISDKFKAVQELTIKQGRHHAYIGMDIIFNDSETVTIKMKDHTKETIHAFSNESPIKSSASTPPRLCPKRSELFHHCVAKLLYLSNRCRLGVLLTVSFLCTRVTCSTEEDWLKLRRLIHYLYRVSGRLLSIGVDDISMMSIFVDASYAVNNDMKRHTGGCIVCSRGAIMAKSVK